MTREYEWTLVKTIIERELRDLDKEFKRARARERKKNIKTI